jgi:Mg-chelatase subunit ChlD
MPQVKEFVRREYGRELVTKNIDVDTIVAAGAAMQAKLCVENRLVLGGASAGTRPATLGGSDKKRLVITGTDIQDITSHSLGMLALSKDETTYKNSIIIKKNSSLNIEFGKEYNFAGTQMDVFVLQGESEEPRDCTLLYKYCVSGFVKGKKTDFTLYFVYNQNGILDVRADAKDRISLLVEKSIINETIDEIINRLLREREEQKRKASRAEIMFMVDTSYSMEGEPIRLARDAIQDFVKELDLSRFNVSIVNFADSGRFECNNENNIRNINKAISLLAVETCGIGNAETPLNSFGNRFSENDINHIIVVLTDGVWSNQATEIAAARRLKADGITIYAIGFGGADEIFLNKIASDAGARKIDLSRLSETFVEIASSIATER